jgi:pimeloyl-[acyl-carrier protein] synthase
MAAKRLEFNPFSPEFQDDPYPIYQQLRTIDPVHRVPGFRFNQWFLSRYGDVQFVLNDPRFRVDDLPDRLADKAQHLKQGNFEPLIATISNWLFFLEPPDHTRLRSLVQKTFSAMKVEPMRPMIQRLVNDLIDPVAATGRIDMMADLAAPLPALVSSEMLGIPGGDRAQLTEWAYTLFHVFDQPLSLQDYQRIDQVAEQFRHYFGALITDLRRQPQDNLISKLIRLSDEDGKLSEAELLGFLSMLFSVGQETTENLIGNGLCALVQNPDRLAELRAKLERPNLEQPNCIGSAVEELLRYDSPVQIISRTAIAPVSLPSPAGEQTIQPGDKVNLLLGAANRDPQKFGEPDRLDWTRKENSRLPFGSGIHYCLGAELARLQGQVAIATVLQRLPNLQWDAGKTERRKNIVLRGFKVLPMTFG